MIDYGYGVQLGALEHGHVERIRKWRNDAKIYKWTRQFEPITHMHHMKWYESLCGDPSRKMMLVSKKDAAGGELVLGVAGLTDVDYVNRHAEFSLYIDPKQQRKGYGEAALKTLFDYGFRVLNLNKIYGETFSNNVDAIACFRKIGMDLVGTRSSHYFRDGEWLNAIMFEIFEDHESFA